MAHAQNDPPVEPPDATKKTVTFENHDDTRTDHYYWLNDKTNPEVIDYLNSENEYTSAMMEHTSALQKTLFDEMLSRIKEDDTNVPVRRGNWMYYTRTEEGKPYTIHCRKRSDVMGATEEIILDENELADGVEYHRLANFSVSPDHSTLAFAIDNSGGEKYTLFFKDLATGEIHTDTISGVYYSVAWANDNKTIFYVRPDHAMRPYQLWRHALGTSPSGDALVYQEDDERFFLGVSRSRSNRYIIASLGSSVTNEAHFVDADAPTSEWQLLQERIQDVEYSVEHHGEHFYILTNADDATNFKIVRAPVASPSKEHWETVVPHDEKIYYTGIDAFSGHMAISAWKDANPTILLRDMESGEISQIDFPDEAYSAYVSQNPEFETDTLRFGYTSMLTPRSTYDYSVATGERTLRKQIEVPGFDPSRYEVRREWAIARDGVKVPVSILMPKGTELDGSNPMLLYSYGSYGSSSRAGFSSIVFSLLDRGFVYAVAHIRGGSEMGRTWYLDGKYFNKKNTFTDFIDSAKHLVDRGYTNPDKLAIYGGSAGGLLMGAVVNMEPDLFGACIAAVPFVDVITTMLDETIPLTVIEWEEWGNPNQEDYYDYMKSYAPYENVEAKDYPAMLVTAGLNDPRVGYWEPAKWVAKMRDLRTDDNALLLKTHMGAGHGGRSGRYGYLEDRALMYAFIIDQLGAPYEIPQD
ncbi:MAG: S9 family peptidase [Phycisphaerales bacterium JB043]